MRKRFCAIILAIAMVMTMIPVAMAASPDRYDDISGHWAESSIDRWSGYGVVNGAGDGQFAPDRTLTRAEAAQIFANLLGLTAAASLGQYVDVAVGSWYYDAIAKCVAAGILTGTGGATMSPETGISRQELFGMYARALSIQPKTSADTSFTDSASVASWAAGYINALADMGAIQGGGDGSLDPTGDINRASFVALLDQSISGYANTDNATVGGTSGIVLVVADNVTVMGNVESLVVVGGSAGVSGSSVGTITVTGDDASVSVGGSASVGQVNVTGANASVTVSGQATVTTVTVADTAVDATVTVNGDATVSAVDSAAAGVTISGTGTVETATVSGDDTTVDTDGTDLTVTEGTTGVTENDKPVAGGDNVTTDDGQTTPEQPDPTPSQPVTPPVHIHSYIATEIKAADAPETTVAVQYTCYAGDHSYIELNGNAVAQVGTRYYTQVGNALNSANNEPVIVLQNCILNMAVNISTTVTLDMAGYTMTVDGAGIIDVHNNGLLTVDGNGTMTQLMSSEIGYLIRANGDSKVTIENGRYIAGLTCIQAGDDTVVEIYDGVFEALVDWKDTYWHLNLIDNSNAKIVVYGGTFKNYNPAESHTENPVANFVADGYTVTTEEDGEDTWYTVVPLTAENSVAEVNGVYYENLTDAVAAADNTTVTLLKDSSITNTPFTEAITGKTITLEMASNDITLTVNQDLLTQTGVDKDNNPLYNVAVNVTADQEGTLTSLTIRNGKLQLNNATYTTANFAVETGCSLTLENVDVNAKGSVLFPSGDAASVTVRNSTITTTGVYGIGTNAATTDNYKVVITVENSTINMEASDGDSCGLIINVAGTMNVSDTTVNGQRQAAIVRAGTASFTNCTLNSEPVKLSWVTESMYTGSWGSGDEVPYGALIVGNQTSNSYLADAIVTLENCDLSVAAVTEDDAFKVFAIYAIRLNNDNYKTAITATGENNITGTVLNYSNTATISGLDVGDSTAANE